MATAKRPAFQFYPSDWLTDLGLRMCSLEARGLWMEMLCLMHQGERYGYLSEKIEKKLQKLCGLSPQKFKKTLKELEENDVFSRDENGIFSRRMVRDEAVRDARANGGNAGASHGHKGAEHGAKGGRPRKSEEETRGDGRGVLETPLKPPPSSSSSMVDNNKPSTQETPRARQAEPPRNEPGPNPRFAAVIAAAGIATFPSDLGDMLDEWDRDGIDFDMSVVPAIREAARQNRENGGRPVFRIRYFDQAVRERHDADLRELARYGRIIDQAASDPPHPSTLVKAASNG